MLGQRRRRWGDINPTLGQRLVFAGYLGQVLTSVWLLWYIVGYLL